jgi:hypothetical protein
MWYLIKTLDLKKGRADVSRRRKHQPQTLGNFRSVGCCGIQPNWRPAEYDHSCACSAFHVHITHPLAFSKVMTF